MGLAHRDSESVYDRGQAVTAIGSRGIPVPARMEVSLAAAAGYRSGGFPARPRSGSVP